MEEKARDSATKTEAKHTYTISGKKFERLEDIPDEFKSYFEDKNNNGIPDQMDSIMSMTGSFNSFGARKFIKLMGLIYKLLVPKLPLTEVFQKSTEPLEKPVLSKSPGMPIFLKIAIWFLIVFGLVLLTLQLL